MNKKNGGTGASFVFDAAYTMSHGNHASDEFSCHVRRSVRYSVLNQSAISTNAADEYSSSHAGEGVVLDAEWRCVNIQKDGGN